MKIYFLDNPEKFGFQSGRLGISDCGGGCSMKLTSKGSFEDYEIQDYSDGVQIFKDTFGEGAEWSLLNVDKASPAIGISVSDQMSETIRIIEEISEVEGVYSQQQIQNMRAAQILLIEVFGHADIRNGK